MDNIIEEMQKRVWFEMDWSAKNDEGDRLFPNKPEKEMIFKDNVALSVLLFTEVIFLNDHWWENSWPEEARKITSLNVNVNDVLMWGCADAIEMEYDELQTVYEYWEKDPIWGTAVWYCKKQNLMPQKPVAEEIRKMGIWDIDNMGLQNNPTDSYHESTN